MIETPLTKPTDARRAAQSTYDAVLWVLREYGEARAADDWMRPPIAQFSAEQLSELIAAMRRLEHCGNDLVECGLCHVGDP